MLLFGYSKKLLENVGRNFVGGGMIDACGKEIVLLGNEDGLFGIEMVLCGGETGLCGMEMGFCGKEIVLFGK